MKYFSVSFITYIRRSKQTYCALFLKYFAHLTPHQGISIFEGEKWIKTQNNKTVTKYSLNYSTNTFYSTTNFEFKKNIRKLSFRFQYLLKKILVHK